MKVADDILMAYADGELDPELREQIAAEIAADPVLAAKLAQHQRLRDRLRSELDATLNDPLPDTLIALLQENTQPATQTTAATDNIVALPGKGRTRRPLLRSWLAMAAALMVGIGIGVLGAQPRHSIWVATGANGMQAHGPLARALSSQLASTQPADAAIRIGISFKSRDGHYCRTFSTQGDHALTGLACHDRGDWHLQLLTLAPQDSTTGSYRQAGSALSPALAQMIEREMSGQPLDAKAEVAARAAGWHN